MKRVTIVNKFGPTSNAVTGQNAKELADFLRKNDIAVRFVSLRADYQSAAKNTTTDTSYENVELKSVYTGRSPGLRFIASLFDGFRLWNASRDRKGDAVIVMTDPPLLFMWFQLFRAFSRRKLIYWTMDLYPEAFVAGGYIRSTNLIYKLFYRIVYGKLPDLVIVLGNEQRRYLEQQFRSKFPAVTVPCGVIERNFIMTPAINANPGKITFGYGGNIGEAHDAEFLIAFTRQLDPQKHQMIVSLYGAKAGRVKEAISGNSSIQFRKFLNLDDIASIDVNIASLLPEWNHICVPSKAVTAVCCGSALLLNATPAADNWQMFQNAGWLIESGDNYDAKIKQALGNITEADILTKRRNAVAIGRKMVIEKEEAYQQVAAYIRALT